MSPGDTVTVSPNPALVNQTDNVTFTCGSLGGPGNTFEWSFNGQILSGATDSSLTISNGTASDGGNYTCEVANSAGSGSDAATLTGECMYFIKIVLTRVNKVGQALKLILE